MLESISAGSSRLTIRRNISRPPESEIKIMKRSGETVLGALRHWRAHLRGNGAARKYSGDELPLRSELFSSDQMKQHGKVLAGSHKLGLAGAPDRLLTRLAENERVLIGACNLPPEAVRANRRISPGGLSGTAPMTGRTK
jgi:hypothetical protein